MNFKKNQEALAKYAEDFENGIAAFLAQYEKELGTGIAPVFTDADGVKNIFTAREWKVIEEALIGENVIDGARSNANVLANLLMEKYLMVSSKWSVVTHADVDALIAKVNGLSASEVSKIHSRVEALLDTQQDMIKNIFTPDEWMFMTDSRNGILSRDSARYNAYDYVGGLCDSVNSRRWKVNFKALATKIRSLEPKAVEALVRRIEAFWEPCLGRTTEEWANF